MIRVRSRHSCWPEVEALPSRGHTDGRAGIWGEQGSPRMRRDIVSEPGSKIHNRHLHRQREEILDDSML